MEFACTLQNLQNQNNEQNATKFLILLVFFSSVMNKLFHITDVHIYSVPQEDSSFSVLSCVVTPHAVPQINPPAPAEEHRRCWRIFLKNSLQFNRSGQNSHTVTDHPGNTVLTVWFVCVHCSYWVLCKCLLCEITYSGQK